jgi:hypothetical protein
MNNDIAGNIMSLVSGFDDNLAAVAKELNATSTTGDLSCQTVICGGPWETPTRNANPKRRVQGLMAEELFQQEESRQWMNTHRAYSDFPKHLELLVVPYG